MEIHQQKNHNFALQLNQHENTSTSDLLNCHLRGQHSTTQQDNGAEGDECFPATVVISYCSHSAIVM